ncbi:MAG: DUF357 domain-containing protein [Candidatus Aenigmarchaeota archaeon]|nr:DUF357 domain-containing protein [Candidatus Aenigmarchaeota archaeon]MCX8190969.1 DUF357 domain-containing protein [Candidatus Aenigmarchaeota archaeon]MDW8160236.1 DUF357 domain-containing protein [Candidatus Aenigmarchaeota archaeon]
MELEDLCKKEIEKMEKVFKEIKVVDKNGLELYNLALSYFTDSKYFSEKKDLIRAFEAIVISWAYIDAGLHLKLFDVPSELKIYFTIQ